MKIMSFNVRNRYRIKNYDGIYKNKDTVIMLSNYIKDNTTYEKNGQFKCCRK